MSGTKSAPARLSRGEQVRIQKALAEAGRINETLGQAAAAAARCRATVEGLDAGAREHLRAVSSEAEQARQAIDERGAQLACEVHQVQEGLNRALAIQNARALPALGDRVRDLAEDLDERARALEEQTQRISRLSEEIAADEVVAERCRAQRRKARLTSLLERLQTRLSTDQSFQWVSPDAAGLLADGRRRLEGDVADDDCATFEQQLEQLRGRALEAERLYHERRRTADLVRELFHAQGFEVSNVTEPPHGSTEDIASTFTPADERLLVTIGTRHPWARDEEQRQLLELTMVSRTSSEETKDPFCVDRLRDFALRAREMGIEIGDVLQPLPGGGYECVLSADSVFASEQSGAAGARRPQARQN